MLDTRWNMIPIVFIPLNQGKVAVVDFDDFERVRYDGWYASSEKSCGTTYARRTIRHPDKPDKQTCVQMHTQITGWKRADHRNGNGLDNRRTNLRQFGHSKNLRSFQRKASGKSSKFRGVSWHNGDHKWRTVTSHPWKFIGNFDSEEEAARAWDAAATRLGFSDEALNFPPNRDMDFAIL